MPSKSTLVYMEVVTHILGETEANRDNFNSEAALRAPTQTQWAAAPLGVRWVGNISAEVMRT